MLYNIELGSFSLSIDQVNCSLILSIFLFLFITEIESSTVTRHKNNDGAPTHGPSHVSDYLPVPAPLYRYNQTVDQLQANNINSDEVELQTSPVSVGYQNDDISDLAHPAVAAISNLKTLPPASSPQPFLTKTEPPFTQQIIFSKGKQLQSNIRITLNNLRPKFL